MLLLYTSNAWLVRAANELFAKLAAHLTWTGRLTTIVEAKTFQPPARGLRRARATPIGDAVGFLQDERTGDYWVMSCEDFVGSSMDVLRAAAEDRRCRAILKQQYDRAAFAHGALTRVKPWIYTPWMQEACDRYADEARRMPILHRSAHFRGSVKHADRQPILERLIDRGVVWGRFEAIAFRNYLAEMGGHAMVLSLPGWGHLCHRMVEAFSIGRPVIMPRQKNQLHDPLIPDHHYINVDVSVGPEHHELVADLIERRYREVIDNHALLEKIARNGLDWYQRNARYPDWADLTLRLLGLSDELPHPA